MTLPLAVLELAKWTRHLPDCARAETTALRCTCGLGEAWDAVETLYSPPPPGSLPKLPQDCFNLERQPRGDR